MDIDKSLNMYCSISHSYAKNMALKRCLFEMIIHNELFVDKEYSFNDFIKDLYCPYIFSKKELKKIYKIAKKTLKPNKIDNGKNNPSM